MHRYFAWVTTHRARVLAIALVVVAVASWLARGLAVDYSVEQFFPTWGPERAVFDEYRTVFEGEDAQVVLFVETPGGLDTASYRTLAEVARAFEAVGLEDVRWAGDIPQIARAADDGRALDVVGRALAADPLLNRFLWSPGRSVHTVQALLPPELNDDADRRRIAARLTADIKRIAPATRWALSGTPMIRAQVPELLAFDQTVLLGGGILLFFVVLFLFFGHAGLVLLSLAAVLPAYGVTLASMAVSGRSITVLTSFIPIVILVVGVCDSTHLLAHWRAHRLAGARASDAARVTFAELATSCFFTSLTTALGFLSLAATGIDVIADFGVFTALAVMVTFGFTISLLPALLSFGRGGSLRARRPRAMGLLVEPVVRAARRAGTLGSAGPIVAFGAVAVVCVIAGSRVVIDAHLVDDLKDDTRIMRDLRWVEGSGFGLFQTNVFVRADAARLTDPAMIAWMERLQRALETEAIVVSTVGLPDVARAATGDGGAAPAASELARGLYRPEYDAAQVVVVVRDAGSRETLPFLRRVDERLRAEPPPFGSADVTGTVRMAHTFSHHVLRSFAPSIGLALLLIGLVMTFLFRSIRLGLLALVPNVFPLVVLPGVMAALGVALKPSSILVFSIAFGIAVDDSIHLMGRYTHLLRRGVPKRSAIRRALRDTGPALVMSTVVVSAGFALLLVSRFELLYLVGLLTAITAVAALSADLVLFPALLRAASGPVRPRASPSPVRRATLGSAHRRRALVPTAKEDRP